MTYLEKKQSSNLIKRKGDFLFFPRHKFFDFCTAFSSEIFGYENKFISRKIKLFLSKKNKFSKNNNKNYLNLLLKKNPSLTNYHYDFIDSKSFYYFFMQNFHMIFFYELIEKEKILPLQKITEKKQNNLKNAKTEFHIYTDLYYLFNHIEKRKNQKKILLIESTFPDFNFFNLNDFEIIIVNGNHPFGLGNGYLFFCRQEYKNLFQESFLPWHAEVYRCGIHHFFHKQNNKSNKNNFKKIKEWVKSIKELPIIEKVIGKNFFYKIYLKNKKPFEKKIFFFKSNHFFLKNLHFFYNENYFYILLPLETPELLLKNRLKDIYNWLAIEQ